MLRSAITTAMHFPWPDGSHTRVVIARKPSRRAQTVNTARRPPPSTRRNAADRARRALSRRWPDVEVVIVDKAPVNGNPGRGQTIRGRRHRAWMARSWRGSSSCSWAACSRGCPREQNSAVLVVRQAKRVEPESSSGTTSRRWPSARWRSSKSSEPPQNGPRDARRRLGVVGRPFFRAACPELR